jgi:hypothetical protein
MKRFVRNLIIKAPVPRKVTNRLLACLTYSDFVDKIKRTTRIPHAYDARDIFWKGVVERIGSSEPVLFLEFGVFRGESMSWFSKHFTNPNSRFMGFDTFTGLPEDWKERNLPQGTFSTNGQTPALGDSRISFVKGLFSDTLPKTIHRIKEEAQGKTVLVHLDADLFSSTLFVLTFLWPWLDRYYVLFDEFFGEESWALSAFTQSYPCELEFFASDVSSDQASVPTPARLFGLIRSTGRQE